MRRNWALPRLLAGAVRRNHFNRSNLAFFRRDREKREEKEQNNYANESKMETLHGLLATFNQVQQHERPLHITSFRLLNCARVINAHYECRWIITRNGQSFNLPQIESHLSKSFSLSFHLIISVIRALEGGAAIAKEFRPRTDFSQGKLPTEYELCMNLFHKLIESSSSSRLAFERFSSPFRFEAA